MTRLATRRDPMRVGMAVAALVVVAVLVASMWPRHQQAADDRPAYEGLRVQVAQECAVDPSDLHDMSDEGFAVFWSWTDAYGGRHRASVQTPGGTVFCGR